MAKRRYRLLAYGSTAVVIAVVAVLVGVGLASTGGGSPRKPAPASAVSQMENIPLSTLIAATTKVTSLNPAVEAVGGPVSEGGKPELLFIGAEFCPVCAAERWPMTIALMKFGTFTNLAQTHSAVQDGNVGTWSYYGSSYTSSYLTFQPYETEENAPYPNYKTLETPSQSAKALWTANLGSNLTFPFIDFAGKLVLTTAQYDPAIVEYRNFAYILGSVGRNDSTVGAQIDASAAVFTKYICNMTGDQPTSVCAAVASVNAPISASRSGPTSPSG